MKGKRRALISVSDKSGVVEFAKGLEELGFEIVSTGGTLTALKQSGVKAISISDITGFPECLDGRVKTLHPSVHAGLLARRDSDEHMKQLKKLDITPIDVVAVNLYPFKQTISKPNVELSEAIENIDIGGPTMLRSAAKNYNGVIVCCDPNDYGEVLNRLKAKTDDDQFRLKLAYKVFRHTAEYDALITEYLQKITGDEMGEHVIFAFDRAFDMRYGENPHQNAAFYSEPIPKRGSLATAVQLNGKQLSYNNINDAQGALDLIREFSDTTVVASKHANPCGVCSAPTIAQAFKGAYECDPMSIFGGIIACNRTVDAETALQMSKIFLEIIIAPDYTDEALEILKKKPNLRVLKLDGISDNLPKDTLDFKRVHGGLLVQQKDLELFDKSALQVVTKRAPTADELNQLEFAFKVVKHAKSNAIALAKDFCAIGVGMGQTNRIWACEQAIEHANTVSERTKGAVMASDAYFPFDDCVKAAAKAGITAVIHPGGSVRDADSIKVCDENNMAMVFTNMRHFKH